MKAELFVELEVGAKGELRLKNGAKKEVTLREVKGIPSLSYIAFEGADSPEAAKLLSQSELWVEREALAELPAGQYYAADLVGLAVRDAKRGLIGKVAAVLETGSNDCLEIQPETGESFLIPMTDDVIESVESELKVRLLPGLHPDESEEA